jgi:hypothetical protein
MWSCGFFEFFSTFAPSGSVFLFLFFLLWFSSSLEQLQLDLDLVLLSFPFSSFVEPLLSVFSAFCLFFSSLVAFWLDRHPALGVFKACLT